MLSSWHPAKWGINKNIFYKNTGETKSVFNPPSENKDGNGTSTFGICISMHFL